MSKDTIVRDAADRSAIERWEDEGGKGIALDEFLNASSPEQTLGGVRTRHEPTTE